MTFKRIKGVLAAACLCGLAQARTVALWPLDYDTYGSFDGRCAVDPRFDLAAVSANVTNLQNDVQWNLPPNPDGTRTAYPPVSRSSVQSRRVAGNGFLYNDAVGVHVRRDRDFTVEGWLRLHDLPARKDWAVVATGNDVQNQDSVGDRWVLSFRRRETENYACSWILWAQGGSDRLCFADADEAASLERTNAWVHVALVHRAAQGGRDTWQLYLDGARAGEEVSFPYSAGDVTKSSFDLGGRRTSWDRTLAASFDYWRISDVCLAPEQFLCAGGTGTRVPSTPRTVAYWPLGVTEAGGVDGRDAVGDSPLTSGFDGMSSFRECRMGASAAAAFTGNPPNATVILPDGNAGSLQGALTGGCLKQDAVGAALDLSSSFTVEGWFAPRICERPDKGDWKEVVCPLFGTRPDYQKGWSFQYRARSVDNVQFDLYCIDQAGVLQANPKLSGSFDMAAWYETWHHVALVYDVAGGEKGFGRWTLFLDGAETGHVDNARAVQPIKDARPFILGGRANVIRQSFQGKVDCVRVARSALAPAQFLNAAADAKAATDVLALWPLNVEGGVYLDLRDVSGNDHHFAPQRSSFERDHVTAVPDVAPVISNPDASPNVRGDPARVNGCTLFRDVDGHDQHQSCLATGSPSVTDAVRAGQAFTFECYYRRTRAKTSGQECFFIVANAQNAVRVRFFRTAEGFKMWENLNSAGDLPDTLIPGTSDGDLLPDTWYHVALVHTIEDVDGTWKTVWRVYVDGVLKGDASADRSANTSAMPCVLIGGRWFRENNSVNGCLSSARLSRGALAPEDFLCAPRTTDVPAAPATAGYWPLDATTGAGLANLADAAYPLVAEGTATVQETMARPAIPNASALTNLVTGDARRNHGSYAFGTAGALVAENVGFALSLRRPFTLEGWLRWDEATGEQDLVSVGAEGEAVGVRLTLDATDGAPRLRVKARGAWPCTPFVDAAFEADRTFCIGEWTHLAVVYDPGDGAGSWTLFVNGVPQGAKVRNFYAPTALDYIPCGDLRIGSTRRPLLGAVDLWRLTEGALAAEDLLWAKLPGLVILVR